MVVTRYSRDREVTPAFLATADEWLAASGELFVVFRFLAAAGAKEYGIYDSPGAFRAACKRAPVGTDIIIFRMPQLPMRGICSTELIEKALEQIPANAEYLVLELGDAEYRTIASPGYLGQGHESLKDDLESLAGRPVAVGSCPNFIAPDNDSMVSAAKGGIDGPR